ncbi:heme-containing dehydratase protein [Phaeosphaeriaceae sp. PMI808]|nr:heme-containing dehydratase protein [Phaeosphaeriaceae sp. PMI808]
MSCPIRLYPFRKPKDHHVPIPRWRLSLPQDINKVYTTYIGVQQHSDSEATEQTTLQAIHVIQEWLTKSDGPSAFETFTQFGHDGANSVAVWVCYWTDVAKSSSSLEKISLSTIYSNLPACGQASVGLWQESFATSVSRLETNYSGIDYLPGLARVRGVTTAEHDLSAYWGAARDRIPDSSHDLFPHAVESARIDKNPRGLGEYLVGTNAANLVHIRSGQFWENCGQQEADSYEQKLEPTLRAGLQYLSENAEETGAIGLRYLRNEDLPVVSGSRERKETCGAGFFANLEDLEKWAKTHQSHLRIYRGALSHYKAFGDARKFRTWHEVSVIKEGDAKFEYLNCTPNTGAIGHIPFKSHTTNAVPVAI